MRRVLAFMLLCVFSVCSLPTCLIKAQAEVYFENCGENLTWEYDDDTHVLTIFGEGEMKINECPWFYFKSEIREVQFDGNITSIESLAFSDCTELTQITLPESVRSVDTFAFSGCGKLKKIVVLNPDCTFPSKYSPLEETTVLISAPDSAVQEYAQKKDLPFWGHIYENGTCTLCGESSLVEGVYEDDNGKFPWTLDLETGAFFITGTGQIMGQSYASGFPWASVRLLITSATVGDGITALGDYMFCGCAHLQTISLPEGLTAIGEDAFGACHNIKNIVLPSSVQTIAPYAFFGCYSLETITLPDGIVTIEEGTFEDAGIIGLLIPDTVTMLGEDCFFGCKKLSAVSLGKGITALGKSLQWCDALKMVQFTGNRPSDLATMIDHSVQIYYPEENSTWAGISGTFGNHEVISFKAGEEIITEAWLSNYIERVKNNNCFDLDELRLQAEAVPGRYVSVSGEESEDGEHTQSLYVNPKLGSQKNAYGIVTVVFGFLFVGALAVFLFSVLKKKNNKEEQ